MLYSYVCTIVSKSRKTQIYSQFGVKDKLIFNKNDNNNDLLKNVDFLYWPPNCCVRYLYDEYEKTVTYSKLVKFYCKKFNIFNENDCLILLYIIKTQQWIICDDINDFVMIEKPLSVVQTTRAKDFPIVVVLDLSKFEFPDHLRNKYQMSSTTKHVWICNTLSQWPKPPNVNCF